MVSHGGDAVESPATAHVFSCEAVDSVDAVLLFVGMSCCGVSQCNVEGAVGKYIVDTNGYKTSRRTGCCVSFL